MDIFSAYKCNACGHLMYPQYAVCSKCGGRLFTPVPLGDRAKLLTFTRLYNLPEGIDKDYLDFGILMFDNGIRVSAQLELKTQARTGMMLKAGAGTVRTVAGREIRGLIFTE